MGIVYRRRGLGTVVFVALSCIYIYNMGFNTDQENFLDETPEDQQEKEQHVQFYSLREKFKLLVKSVFPMTYQAVPSPEPSYQVPLIIHFIWIGSRIQEEYVRNIDTWAYNNNNYQVILWTDNLTFTVFTDLQTNFTVRDVFKEVETFASRDIIEYEDLLVCKADILRYEIMYKYGGVYTDVDSWSVQPLGPVFQHSFVTIQPNPPHYIQNCIYGFPPTSHYMRYVLALVREHYQLARVNQMEVSVKYGPVFFTTAFVNFGDDNIHVIDGNFLLDVSGESVVVQLFDGNWLGKRELEDDEEVLKHLLDRAEQKHQDYIEDMEYEDEIDESYVKLKII